MEEQKTLGESLANIGNLALWHRDYAYKYKPGEWGKNVVDMNSGK